MGDWKLSAAAPPGYARWQLAETPDPRLRLSISLLPIPLACPNVRRARLAAGFPAVGLKYRAAMQGEPTRWQLARTS